MNARMSKSPSREQIKATSSGLGFFTLAFTFRLQFLVLFERDSVVKDA